MPKWSEGVITKRTNWSPDLITIRVRVPDIQPFLPGQFLQLGVYYEEQVEGEGETGTETKLINRPYSVASPHGDVLDFFIVIVEEGQLTPKLWKLSEGDRVQVSKRAAGSFTLEKTPAAENLWLVATGTGLAPYIAMLRTPTPFEKYHRVFLVHGVRGSADLAYTEELLELEKTFPGRFKLIQSMTREETDGTLHGRIPNLLEGRALESFAGAEMRKNTCSVLLCGNPAMLDSMEQLLEKRQMIQHRSKSPGNIVLERYW